MYDVHTQETSKSRCILCCCSAIAACAQRLKFPWVVSVSSEFNLNWIGVNQTLYMQHPMMINHHVLSNTDKHFSGFGFSNKEIFLFFLYDVNLSVFVFWTVVWTKQATVVVFFTLC